MSASCSLLLSSYFLSPTSLRLSAAKVLSIQAVSLWVVPFLNGVLLPGPPELGG